MTPGNRIRLEKAGKELQELSKSRSTPQETMIAILRTIQLIHHVLEDLALRPEVN